MRGGHSEDDILFVTGVTTVDVSLVVVVSVSADFVARSLHFSCPRMGYWGNLCPLG